jgi:hypothetical protein
VGRVVLVVDDVLVDGLPVVDEVVADDVVVV